MTVCFYKRNVARGARKPVRVPVFVTFSIVGVTESSQSERVAKLKSHVYFYLDVSFKFSIFSGKLLKYTIVGIWNIVRILAGCRIK